LSGRGLCDELITRPEESYRLCCVVACDLETSRMDAPYIYDISRLRVKPRFFFLILSTIKTYKRLQNKSNTVWEKMFGSKKTCSGKRERMVALRNSSALAKCKTVGAWRWTLISTHTSTWRSQIDREASFVSARWTALRTQATWT